MNGNAKFDLIVSAIAGFNDDDLSKLGRMVLAEQQSRELGAQVRQFYATATQDQIEAFKIGLGYAANVAEV